MSRFTLPLILLILPLSLSACLSPSTEADRLPASLQSTSSEGVCILRGCPQDTPAFAALKQRTHCLILVPGISSGNLTDQARFLGRLRRRIGADLAVFHHWGHQDPTRKIASPLATATAGKDLAALCQALRTGSHGNIIIDILAHSAGTIVTNKAAILMRQSESPIQIRRVLFVGTPHDPEVDVSALREMSQSILNLHSCFDKINRNVSGALGVIHALSTKPDWNARMDRTLGGRRVRHYTFLEDTPENWLQYSHYFYSGDWLREKPDIKTTPGSLESLYLAACRIRNGTLSARDNASLRGRGATSLMVLKPENRYYGALLLGLTGNKTSRAPLKQALEDPAAPVYLRRELYQALGNLSDPRDLRYLQGRRKIDPGAGDVLRDVLRDWKRQRIRPPHPNQDT